MKKNLLFVFVLLFTNFIADAQIEKGSWLISATAGADGDINIPTTFNTNSILNFMPGIGYCYAKNQVIGIYGSSNKSSFYLINNDPVTNKDFAINLYWRKYYKIRSGFGWYLQADAGLGYFKEDYSHSQYGGYSLEEVNSFSANISAGLYYKFSRHFLLTFGISGLNYSNYNSYFTGQDKVHKSVLKFDPVRSVSIGFHFIIGGK